MRLKSIKLAGFKSFVDPTTVSFPGARSAVVGPNGCGKSNIIDAVRWVMGESSAKQLRGESLTDVILNGSSSRQRTAIASIELLFDNADGRIGGAYSSYGEIAIRREVNREAKSNYYLNGKGCRRRDVMDVFLGTGFGPRSYSIIEQGMISQLVEAKPEELRTYIEEAAGISKYRERRRETENRIRHAKDNLDRLNDIREELDKQISKLKRQAQAAEKYRIFKDEERRATATLHTLRLRKFRDSLHEVEQNLTALDVHIEKTRADLQSNDTHLERTKSEHGDGSKRMNDVQGRFYELGSDIGRIEESIQLTQERVKDLEADIAAIESRLHESRLQLSMDNQHITDLTSQFETLRPSLTEAEQKFSDTKIELSRAEKEMHQCQLAWDEFAELANLNDSEVQVQESQIEHTEQVLLRLRSKRDQLELETKESPRSETIAEAGLVGEIKTLEENYKTAEINLERALARFSESRSEIGQLESVLDHSREEVLELRHEWASLSAIQEAALGRSRSVSESWLEKHSLAKAKRLGESLSVVPGWELAVETVLGDQIKAIHVENIVDYGSALTDMKDSTVTLYEGMQTEEIKGDLPALESMIDISDGSIGSFLSGVFAADTLEIALKYRVGLIAGQSIITRDAVWVGRNWVRLDKSRDEARGIIQREAELESLGEKVNDSELRLTSLQSELVALKKHSEDSENERDTLQNRLSQIGGSLATLRTDHGVRRAREEEAEVRRARVERDRNETESQVGQESTKLAKAKNRLTILVSEAETYAVQRESLLKEKDVKNMRLDKARLEAGEAGDAVHSLRVDLRSLESSIQAGHTARERLIKQSNDLEEQRESLQKQKSGNSDPLSGMKDQLELKLQERTKVEMELRQIRESLEKLESTIRQGEERRRNIEVSIEEIRSNMEDARIEREGIVVNVKNVESLLADTGHSLDEISEHSQSQLDVNEDSLSEELERIERRISRLGPINLAAIDEFDSQSERKEYLDKQNDDLVEALDTLNKAIKRIDRETRSRFKETFDKVNEHLKTLFPKVFGGGHAHLELTGEDLLDTGITLMAQPPGKRNASIHLLSGGEKAMTAVALVFAIFQLNPSPVCMLDEVDAPLDDSNVTRFADLIEEMSSEVQFVVITHNKLTMEMADHLLGVTMHEAGVSRLVSVDVEQAAEMAAV
ncbi:MAG: chromosome segregation protein SMC [Pseudomonadales bacterium]|nr:chromosome segregation protein SMC [Pseudomonadales bacterium]